MSGYDIFYRDNGIAKIKGFGYKEDFDKFLYKLQKNAKRYSDIHIAEYC